MFLGDGVREDKGHGGRVVRSNGTQNERRLVLTRPGESVVEEWWEVHFGSNFGVKDISGLVTDCKFRKEVGGRGAESSSAR